MNKSNKVQEKHCDNTENENNNNSASKEGERKERRGNKTKGGMWREANAGLDPQKYSFPSFSS